MRALVFKRSPAMFSLSKLASKANLPAASFLAIPLSLEDVEEPAPRTDDWRILKPLVSGICGSDLAALRGEVSLSFEELVSFPFIPGHEVVAREEDSGQVVVVKALLSCQPRGLPPCAFCLKGQIDKCKHNFGGELGVGMQLGFCREAPGGWAETMTAHKSQLLEVPEELSLLNAALVEPSACAIHSVHSCPVSEASLVCVIGAGAIGLLTIAALKKLFPGLRVITAAKHREQKKLSEKLGADAVVDPGSLKNRVRLETRSLLFGGALTHGCDLTFVCAGSKSALALALEITRPGGEVVLSGLPSPSYIDLSQAWLKELSLKGAYGYCSKEGRDDFEIAFELTYDMSLGPSLLRRTYRLTEYRAALFHAINAGRLGTPKVAFLPNPRLLKEFKEELL